MPTTRSSKEKTENNGNTRGERVYLLLSEILEIITDSRETKDERLVWENASKHTVKDGRLPDEPPAGWNPLR